MTLVLGGPGEPAQPNRTCPGSPLQDLAVPCGFCSCQVAQPLGNRAHARGAGCVLHLTGAGARAHPAATAFCVLERAVLRGPDKEVPGFFSGSGSEGTSGSSICSCKKQGKGCETQLWPRLCRAGGGQTPGTHCPQPDINRAPGRAGPRAPWPGVSPGRGLQWGLRVACGGAAPAARGTRLACRQVPVGPHGAKQQR